MRFDLFSVRGDGDIPELTESVQFMESRKHWIRIFGAEVDTVHNVRIEQILRNFTGIIRVSNKDISFADPVEEPFAEKSGDVGSASGVEDHGGFTLIDVLFGRIKGRREK